MVVTNLFYKKNHSASVHNDMDKHRRYETLVRDRYRDLYRYAYWLCKDQHVAEDLVQETFLKAWRFLDNLKDEKATKSWLITILRRENASRFERKQYELVDIDECVVKDSSYPGSERDIEQQWLQRQIMALAPKYREPLVLRLMAGFNNDEIAGILGLNCNTVTTRLFRARTQLKDQQEYHKEVNTKDELEFSCCVAKLC